MWKTRRWYSLIRLLGQRTDTSISASFITSALQKRKQGLIWKRTEEGSGKGKDVSVHILEAWKK